MVVLGVHEVLLLPGEEVAGAAQGWELDHAIAALGPLVYSLQGGRSLESINPDSSYLVKFPVVVFVSFCQGPRHPQAGSLGVTLVKWVLTVSSFGSVGVLGVLDW